MILHALGVALILIIAAVVLVVLWSFISEGIGHMSDKTEVLCAKLASALFIVFLIGVAITFFQNS